MENFIVGFGFLSIFAPDLSNDLRFSKTDGQSLTL